MLCTISLFLLKSPLLAPSWSGFWGHKYGNDTVPALRETTGQSRKRKQCPTWHRDQESHLLSPEIDSRKATVEILLWSSHRSSKINNWSLPEHCLLSSYLRSKWLLEKGRKVSKLLMKVRLSKGRGLEVEGWRKNDKRRNRLIDTLTRKKQRFGLGSIPTTSHYISSCWEEFSMKMYL